MIAPYKTEHAESEVPSTGSVNIFASELSCYAGIYEVKSRAEITNSNNPSWAFGKNGRTLTFIPPEEIYHFEELLEKPKISKRNLEAIHLLEEWFSKPDDLGREWWNEFDREFEENRFRL